MFSLYSLFKTKRISLSIFQIYLTHNARRTGEAALQDLLGAVQAGGEAQLLQHHRLPGLRHQEASDVECVELEINLCDVGEGPYYLLGPPP